MKIKNEKGFTIVELLAVLFILSLLSIMLISYYGKTLSKIEEESRNSAKAILEDALDVYYHLNLNDGTLKYYIEDNKIITCVKVETLIRNGFLAEEDYDAAEFLKLTVKNGKISYEKIEDLSACDYEEISVSGVYEGSTSTGAGTGDVDSFTFDQNVSMVDVNTFNVDIDFSFKALMSFASDDYKDTYVMMILDNSGSMGSPLVNGATPMSAANAAVTGLAATLSKAANPNYNFCTGLINFNTNSALNKPFTNKAFTSTIAASGNTNYLSGLQLAESTIYQITTTNESFPDVTTSISGSNVTIKIMNDTVVLASSVVTFSAKATVQYTVGAYVVSITYGPNTNSGIQSVTLVSGPKIVSTINPPRNYDLTTPECAKASNSKSSIIIIFLTDGEPNTPNSLATTYLPSAKSLKNRGAKLLTIGYNLTATGRARLLEMASYSCGPNKDEVCHFDANTSTIEQQLKELAYTTIEESRESKYKSGKIELVLNQEYFIYESAGASNISYQGGKVVIGINLNDYDPVTGNFKSDYDFNIKYNGKTFSNGQDSMEVSLFTSGKITFYDADGVPSDPAELNNLPKILLTKKGASAVN